MRECRRIGARSMLIGLLLVTGLSGCTVVQKPANYSSDHAVISYWAPAKEGKQLRLAVKDLIDVKGVVTTAGSKYLAQTRPPAKTDAACLLISRARKVQIVGKTNLSELAVAPSGINDFFGTPSSPFSQRRHLIPGGSSCGSAVALAAAGAWINDGKFFDKLIGVSARTKAILVWGEFQFMTSYGNALRRQAAWQRELAETLQRVDFIALPTLQKLPPKVSTTPFVEAQMLNLQNTVAVNFGGNPALAMPIPLDNKSLPATSLQLVGPRLSEAELLNAGRLIEAHCRFN